MEGRYQVRPMPCPVYLMLLPSIGTVCISLPLLLISKAHALCVPSSNFLSISLRTWEPAQNVKEDAPLFFFRYVDRVGLAEQCECGSQSKLLGKAAWGRVLKDGRPSNDNKYVQADNGNNDEEMPLEDTKSTNKELPVDRDGNSCTTDGSGYGSGIVAGTAGDNSSGGVASQKPSNNTGSTKRSNDACTSRQASAEKSSVKKMKCGHAAATPVRGNGEESGQT